MNFSKRMQKKQLRILKFHEISLNLAKEEGLASPDLESFPYLAATRGSPTVARKPAASRLPGGKSPGGPSARRRSGTAGTPRRSPAARREPRLFVGVGSLWAVYLGKLRLLEGGGARRAGRAWQRTDRPTF